MEEEQSGAKLEPNTLAPAQELTTPAGLSELEKRVRGVRAEVQDLADALTRLGERLPAQAASGAAPEGVVTGAPSDARFDRATLPELAAARAPAGDLVPIALSLVNESGEPASVVLRATSLVSERGDEIPGKSVAFTPNPASLPGRGTLPVRASVAVPPGTPPGKYSGLVQAAGLDAARAVLTVIVSPRAAEMVRR